jgi:hypothetical protein
MDPGPTEMAAKFGGYVKFRVIPSMEGCLPARTNDRRRSAMMDHDAHRPGTVPGCERCRESAYEPGWYATLLVVDVDTGATALRLPEEAASVSASSDGDGEGATDAGS